jgi:hypothetical protein
MFMPNTKNISRTGLTLPYGSVPTEVNVHCSAMNVAKVFQETKTLCRGVELPTEAIPIQTRGMRAPRLWKQSGVLGCYSIWLPHGRIDNLWLLHSNLAEVGNCIIDAHIAYLWSVHGCWQARSRGPNCERRVTVGPNSGHLWVGYEWPLIDRKAMVCYQFSVFYNHWQHSWAAH